MRKTQHIAIVFGLFIFVCLQLNAQYEFPVSPSMTNFSTKDHGGGPNSYTFARSNSGTIYVANDAGLLVFDGINWSVNPLPNGKKAGSLYLFEEKVYVGSQNEIGYFIKDKTGKYSYTPLNNTNISFNQIERMHAHDDLILLQTDQSFYQLKNDELSPFLPNIPLNYICEIEEKLLGFSMDAGLHIFSAGKFRKINGSEVLRNEHIVSIISYKPGQLLLCSSNGNIFHYNGEGFNLWYAATNSYVSKHQITSAVKISEQLFAIGTKTGGIVLLDENGDNVAILNDENGLQNNSISTLLADNNANLWVGTHNGIQLLKFQSPIHLLEPSIFQGYPGGKIELLENEMYVTAGNKIFHLALNSTAAENKEFKLQEIEGPFGQCFQLKQVDEKTWYATDNGVYELSHSKATPLSIPWESLDFLKISNQEQMIIAHKKGLDLYEKSNQRWIFKEVIDSTLGPCTKLFQDKQGQIWFHSMYQQVSKLIYDEQFDQYYVEKLQEERVFDQYYVLPNAIILKNQNAFFKYDHSLNRIEPYNDLDQYFTEEDPLISFATGPNGNLWFVTTQEVGVLKVVDAGLRKEINKISFPSIQKKMVRGSEFILPYAPNKAFINSDRGFIHINLDHFSGLENPAIQLHSVVSINPQNRTSYTDLSDLTPTIDTLSEIDAPIFFKPSNTLRFYYSARAANLKGDVVFSTKLNGLEDQWSEWAPETEKLYTNLPVGKYSFQVKTRSPNNVESQAVSYEFKIRTPWYYSIPALIVYGFITLALLYLVSRKQVKKAKKETHLIKSEHEGLEEKLKEITGLNVEQDKKNKEENLFAALQPHLKAAVPIQQIAQHVDAIYPKITEKELQKEVKNLQKFIQDKLNFTKDWAQFSKDFDEVHNQLLSRIIQKYPKLSEKDLRLLAYVKMGLKSKDIAPLLNIKERGVEVSRYRLRKKLGIGNEVKLKDFIEQF